MAPALIGALRCPNLSGIYLIQDDDGQILITINQNKCKEITISRAGGYDADGDDLEKHVLKLDGINRIDAPWFGSGVKQSRTSAKFEGSELILEVEPIGDLRFALIYALTSDHDLKETMAPGPRGDHRGFTYIAKRQR